MYLLVLLLAYYLHVYSTLIILNSITLYVPEAFLLSVCPRWPSDSWLKRRLLNPYPLYNDYSR